ncbi:class I SAM-dependent methyltransferase [Candidatus Paracaedibacter symbiosus]|uniref:class I SAM-dependent methyltransferase n=1 Tax=Candidatus Paracaedibacter symbiosus TaxID=244582 RepID=UPI0005097181|nr:methyltransferase domain-containing protein [Candidatus Paracaedibacter symbiosus]
MYSLTKMIACLFLTSSLVFGNDRCIDLDKEVSFQEAQSIKKQIQTDPNLVQALYQITYDTVQVLDHFEIPYSLMFGSLLGAVRGGGIIHHDDDVDLMFLEEDKPKLEKTKETFASLGYNLFYDPKNIVGYKLYSKTPLKLTNGEEIYPFLDLFTFRLDHENNRYILAAEEGRKIFRNPFLLPGEFRQQKDYNFGEFKAKGLENPTDFFNRFYGPAWNTIAYVSHKHISSLKNNYLWMLTENDRSAAQPTGPLKERVKMFFETHIAPPPISANNSLFWEEFYKKNNLALTPSTFAQYLIENDFIEKDASLVDIACGNGRDTFFFQKNNIKAVGIDASPNAIKSNQNYAKDSGLTTDSFRVVDINDQQKLAKFLSYDNFYARFFIHSISEQEQKQFLDFLTGMKSGAKLFLEFRTDKDPMYQRSLQLSRTEGVTDHYRRYIHFKNFCTELDSLGFSIVYALEAQGLSIHKEDNPYLGRIIALKK